MLAICGHLSDECSTRKEGGKTHYYDEGISGLKTDRREGLLSLLTDCRLGKIDRIIVKSISRFARNTVDCLNYTRELKDLNIAVKFEKENISTLDASGEVLLTIMAALAQQESESLSENVRLGIKFRNEQGKVMVNHNRFLGYTKDSEGHLIIDEEQAKVVRRIYDEYLSGKTYKQIKDGLEADGIKNGAGNSRWQISNLHLILTNEKYIGDALLQKTWTYNTLDKKRRKNHDDAPQYYVSDNHDPIVSRETFAAVKQEMARRANLLGDRNRRRIYSGKYEFSGILFCGECGDLFTRVVWDIRGKKRPVWRCVTRMQSGKDTCSCRTMREDTLKSLVIKAVNRFFNDRTTLSDMVTDSIEAALTKSVFEDTEALQQEIQELQLELTKHKITDPQVEIIGKQILALKKKCDERSTQVALDKKRLEAIREMTAFFDGLSGPVTEYDEQYVRRLLDKITIYEDRVTFRFKDTNEITLDA